MKALFLILSLIFAPYVRERISLNGEWAAIVDQYDIGLHKKLFTDAKPRSKTDFVEFSWDGGLRLQVPGDWNHQDPGLWWYEGTLWYARHFDATPKAGTRRILYFAGVSHRCEVFLNGVKAAEHEGAFTPFQADVTDLLREGDNFLAVRVNNNRRKDAIPAISFDWWNYGGITRDVMLLEVPSVYVADSFFRLRKGTHDTLLADIRLSEALAGKEVTITIPELRIRETIRTDATTNGISMIQSFRAASETLI